MSGPRGSPCWTPSDDWMILSLQNKDEGEEYNYELLGHCVTINIPVVFN